MKNILTKDNNPLLTLDFPTDFIATQDVLQILHEHALLDSSLRLRTMLRALEDGRGTMLADALKTCTAAEVVQFRILALKEDLPYDRSTLRTLLENDLAVFDKNEMLLTACRRGDNDTVERLLAFGASPNYLTTEGSRPVHFGACEVDILKTLVARGADIGTRNRLGETALHIASADGRLGCVKWLLKQGVPIDAKTVDGHTALHDAAHAGYITICQFLLESGAKPRICTKHTGSTPLHYAAQDGWPMITKILLNFNSDLRAQDILGGTPLHTAAFAGHTEIVESILAAVSAEASNLISTGDSDVQADGSVQLDENINMNHILSETRSYIDLRDAKGRTALMLAVEADQLEVLEVLLRKGATVQIADNDGNLPLHNAARRPTKRSAELRLTAVLARLSRAEVAVNAVNHNGNTALHVAAATSNVAAIQIILDLKPDLNIVNRASSTALDILQKYKDEDWELCADLLIHAGAKQSRKALEQAIEHTQSKRLLQALDYLKRALSSSGRHQGNLIAVLEETKSHLIDSPDLVKEILVLLQDNSDQLQAAQKLLLASGPPQT